MSHFAILDNNYDPDGQAWIFDDPVSFVTLSKEGDLLEAFAELEAARDAGFYAVGAMAYELGSLIEPAFASHLERYDGELMSFGIFRSRRSVRQDELDEYLREKCGAHSPFIARRENGIGEAEYLDALKRIRAYLEAGDNYQVNYTFPTHFDVGGCLTALYADLRRAQPVKYGAYLRFPEMTILSRSPELFFQKQGERLETHPMKGTSRRDLTDVKHDEELIAELRSDPKQRAENLMITDLLRNDLSRIAKRGTVTVDELFAVESFPTVHQMLSKISCKVEPAISLLEILRALYPCGSITGAPKIRTSEIIRELEREPRGFYTGAIGFIAPDNDMTFSVPIRTISVDAERRGTMSIGSGVVYDSVGEAEFDECLLKGRFLFDHAPEFVLIESFYANETGGRNVSAHLDRMAASADDLGFDFDRLQLERAVSAMIAGLDAPSKVRVELTKLGEVMVEAVALGDAPSAPKVMISDHKINAHNPVYRYKTSNRGLYNSAFSQARDAGFTDVLFLNTDGFLTEGAIHNVFLKTGETWSTPALDAGLLAGVGRALFIRERDAKETLITLADMKKADEIWLVSSTRGAFKVELSFDR